MKRRKNPEVRRDIGTSVYTGIAEDIPMPIIRSGRRNIEDVDEGIVRCTCECHKPGMDVRHMVACCTAKSTDTGIAK